MSVCGIMYASQSAFFPAPLAEAITASQTMLRPSLGYGHQPSFQSSGMGSSMHPVYGDPQLYYQPTEPRNIQNRRLF